MLTSLRSPKGRNAACSTASVTCSSSPPARKCGMGKGSTRRVRRRSRWKRVARKEGRGKRAMVLSQDSTYRRRASSSGWTCFRARRSVTRGECPPNHASRSRAFREKPERGIAPTHPRRATSPSEDLAHGSQPLAPDARVERPNHHDGHVRSQVRDMPHVDPRRAPLSRRTGRPAPLRALFPCARAAPGPGFRSPDRTRADSIALPLFARRMAGSLGLRRAMPTGRARPTTARTVVTRATIAEPVVVKREGASR